MKFEIGVPKNSKTHGVVHVVNAKTGQTPNDPKVIKAGSTVTIDVPPEHELSLQVGDEAEANPGDEARRGKNDGPT